MTRLPKAFDDYPVVAEDSRVEKPSISFQVPYGEVEKLDNGDVVKCTITGKLINLELSKRDNLSRGYISLEDPDITISTTQKNQFEDLADDEPA